MLPYLNLSIEGGLGLHNFELRLMTSRVMWVKRLIFDLWSDFFKTCCKEDQIVDILLREQRYVLKDIPNFYKLILQAWYN